MLTEEMGEAVAEADSMAEETEAEADSTAEETAEAEAEAATDEAGALTLAEAEGRVHALFLATGDPRAGAAKARTGRTVKRVENFIVS